jgi:hypothetical protein
MEIVLILRSDGFGLAGLQKEKQPEIRLFLFYN